MLQANRDEVDLGFTLNTSDSQKFLVPSVSVLCRIAIVAQFFLTKTHALCLLNLLLAMVTENLTTIRETINQISTGFVQKRVRKKLDTTIVCVVTRTQGKFITRKQA